MVGSLISGSLIPLFLLVSCILTQSLSGPFVSSPMMAPMRMAKLKKPIVKGEYIYGGSLNACVCVRLIVRNEEALQDTTNEANSTIGNAKSFQGIQRSRSMVFRGCALVWKSWNCCLLGDPLPRYGSRCAVVDLTSSLVRFDVKFSTSPSSTCSECTFPSEELAMDSEATFRISFGWSRCHLVSGKPKRHSRKIAPMSPTLSHLFGTRG